MPPRINTPSSSSAGITNSAPANTVPVSDGADLVAGTGLDVSLPVDSLALPSEETNAVRMGIAPDSTDFDSSIRNYLGNAAQAYTNRVTTGYSMGHLIMQQGNGSTEGLGIVAASDTSSGGGSVVAIDADALILTTAIDNAGSIIGFDFRARNAGAGVLANATGVHVGITNGGAGSITEAIGLHVSGTSGAMGTAYGILVDGQETGGTNYAIKTGLGKVDFNSGGDASFVLDPAAKTAALTADPTTGVINLNAAHLRATLPTSDPHVVGELWNNLDAVQVSAG